VQPLGRCRRRAETANRLKKPNVSERTVLTPKRIGFGSNTTTAKGFSSRPAFGGTGTTSTGGGLFGNTNTTATTNTGFGGFGSGNTTSAFGGGSSSAGGGLFGGNKPATAGFGASNTNTGAGLFGGGNASAGFGSNDAVATTGNSLFGGNGTALGGTVPECPGTGGTAFQAFQEKESNSSLNNHFQTITFMSPYQKYSLEVRLPCTTGNVSLVFMLTFIPGAQTCGLQPRSQIWQQQRTARGLRWVDLWQRLWNH